MTLTINCDMGEGFGLYSFGDDTSCLPLITHANVACGFHASDPTIMWRTVRNAVKAGVNIGSHPGLPDREGFGRREIKMTRDEVSALVLYQTGALQAFIQAEGSSLSHIKPHGALFGMAQKEEAVANGIADAALSIGVPVIGFSDCMMSEVFKIRGVPFVCEFYADLDYDDNGRQIITREHQAVSAEDVVAKVIKAINTGKVTSVGGKEVDVVADSICVHSDTPNSLEVAMAVHSAIQNQLAKNLV